MAKERDTLKLRATASGRSSAPDRFYLTVPIHIAELLPREQVYVCELTEEGILYRPVTVEPETPPSWIAAKAS